MTLAIFSYRSILLQLVGDGQLTKSKSYLYLLKGDDNVLFILDENKELRVGNEDFSYTLNRVELVPGKK